MSIRFVAALSALTISSCGVSPLHTRVVKPSTTVGANAPEDLFADLYFIADNQERELFGDQTTYSARFAQDTSDVAIRSVEQDLYTKYVAREVIDRINAPYVDVVGAVLPPIIHLGDVLDYSCASEFRSVKDAGIFASNVYVAPGNHDGVFQGNMTYGGYPGFAFLWIRKLLVNETIDPTLQSHFNTVCRSHTKHEPPLTVKARDEKSKLRDVEDFNHREWPQHFKCDYLRLRLAGNKDNQTIADFCNDAEYFRYYLNYPDSTKALLPTTVSVPGQISYAVSVSSGNSYEMWNRGHMLQRVEIPLTSEQQRGRKADTDLKIGIVMLDTTDWAAIPSFRISDTTNNSSFGAVSEQQRMIIENWLNEWSAGGKVKAAILVGHYPLDKLDESTSHWIAGLSSSYGILAPLYVSAHTHEGYVAEGRIERRNMPNGGYNLHELNVGSLIDAPVHYRSMKLRWRQSESTLQVVSDLVKPEDALRCDEEGSAQHQAWMRASANAAAFKSEKRWKNNRQWCRRAAFAGASLKEQFSTTETLDPSQKVFEPIEYEDCSGKNLYAETELTAGYSGVLSRLQKRANESPKLRQQLACAALAGAEKFSFTKASPPDRAVFDFRIPRSLPSH